MIRRYALRLAFSSPSHLAAPDGLYTLCGHRLAAFSELDPSIEHTHVHCQVCDRIDARARAQVEAWKPEGVPA